MQIQQRESLEFDVVIIGAGPAGLATAIKLRQLAVLNQQAELSVCIIEKGAEVGAHIISGAVMEIRALAELFPDWQQRKAPIEVAVTEDLFYYCHSQKHAMKIAHWLLPKTLHNDGNYIISLANLTRWLAAQAEILDITIFTGFTATDILYHADGRVKGVQTGDFGIAKDGQHSARFTQGYELIARYSIFAEGCRGSLSQGLIQHFQLDRDADPQHYALGIKELWQIDPKRHHAGRVIHGIGWPFNETGSTGGWWLYHAENHQISLGAFIDLNYRNPHLDPFAEMQRLKTHPLIQQYLHGAERISYGARCAVKSGINALPHIAFPGGCLVGDAAGFLNQAKIKGIHTAIKSGMLCAEAIFEALTSQDQSTQPAQSLSPKNMLNSQPTVLQLYPEKFKQSWLKQELMRSRNFAPAIHKFGIWLGGGFNYIEQNICPTPFIIRDPIPDYASLDTITANDFKPSYPKADGVYTFDRLSSVYLSNTLHEENQPVHLKLLDPSIPIDVNLVQWDEPAQRYCPASVYEVVELVDGKKTFHINAANCVHCKTCDIKDPSQNIVWHCPEGGGGPNYPNM